MPPPTLPEELHLHIFTFVELQDLWLSIRLVSRSFNRMIESHIKTDTLPKFVIGINYTLGSGTTHHWYDVRTSVYLSFNAIDKHNPQYALFNNMTVQPEPFHDRAMEKWNRIANTGLGAATQWRVQLRSGNPRTCEMQFVKLPNTVLSQQGAFCDWKELLTAYFRACIAAEPVANGVMELTTPASLHAAAISYVRGAG
ncbi:hypothetical protein CKM354_001263200 [Cercospora kikuchii]|uniref:F-box domain-containing protein n=1 Tax=Cercospora kikuchii TaxID=84275 RepID=A0A9P3L2X0_9PEZI|nr:uncharacterized protein CKM354_001263200 [Cercospora kikuchii]GIZ49602.1 hypothetical protein CKM354_001263200 [Cercospora kikuchii]